MKIANLCISIFLVLFTSCNRRPEADFYKNLITDEMLTTSEFIKFEQDLRQKYRDRGKETKVVIHYYRSLSSKTSIIQPFKYSVREGDKYIIRADSFPKIGMKVLPRKFLTMDGDRVQIGGEQSKPTLINLWFVGCRGCVQEMPILNEIQEKYAGKVNFLALTFDSSAEVSRFLERKKFNFKHITDAEGFIKYIGTKPYPENIFIDRHGVIQNIESVLVEDDIRHLESIIEKLLL